MSRATLLMLTLILAASPGVKADDLAFTEAEVRYQTISLNRALELSVRGNAELRRARARETRVAAEEQGARAFLFPSVTAEGRYMATEDPVSAFGIKLRQGTFSQQDLAIQALNEPDTVQDWVAAARLQWEVGDPTRWAAWSAARHQSDAVRWQVERLKEATALRTRVYYFETVRAVAHLEAARAAEEAAQRLLQQFHRRFEEGTLTRADMLQAEARLAAAQADRIEASRRRREAALQLGLHLGWNPADSLPAPAGGFDAPEPVREASFDLSDRADIKALRSAEEAAQAAKLRATLGYAPRLGVTASIAIHAEEPFDGPAGAFWTAMVTLQWPLFQGLSRAAEREAAEAELHAARIQHQQASREARGEVRQALWSVNAAQRVVIARQGAKVAAEEARRVMSRRFQEGLSTAGDVLSAEARAVQMRASYVDAQASYHLAAARLIFALGKEPEAAASARRSEPSG